MSSASSAVSSAASSRNTTAAPPPDFLRRIFWPQSDVDYKMCLQYTEKTVQVIKTAFCDLHTDSIAGFDMAVQSQDADYLHFIWLCVIPGIRSLTESTGCEKQGPSSDRFINRLLFARNNLVDGLTTDGTDCKTRADRAYSSIREFVAEMRHFYLTQSTVKKTDRAPLDESIKDDRAGLWSKRDFDVAKHTSTGTLWFNIVGLKLFVELTEQQNLVKTGNWGTPSSTVQCVDVPATASTTKMRRFKIIIRHSMEPVPGSLVDVLHVPVCAKETKSVTTRTTTMTS
jgi:hypothetical protein